MNPAVGTSALILALERQRKEDPDFEATLLHSGILSKKMVLADLPGPWQLAYTVHTSMSLLLCLRCSVV